LLERLVDKSLVLVRDGAGVAGDREVRYGLLETIREYALERLRDSGEADDVKRRHAAYFLALAERAEPECAGSEAARWLAGLEVEHDNLRAALAWSLEHDAEGCLRLAGSLGNFWLLHGHCAEARRWLDQALERGRNARARVRALIAAGLQARQQGELAAARAYFETGSVATREAGDAPLTIFSSLNLAIVAMMQGEFAAARASAEGALTEAERTGLDDIAASALLFLGEVARLQERWTDARTCHERALATYRRLGRRALVGITLNNLGATHCETGARETARSCYREAIAVVRELGTTDDIALALDGMGAVAAMSGAWERAALLAGAAEALRESIGSTLEPGDRAFRDRYLAKVREQLDGTRFEAALVEGRAMTLERAVALATDETDDR
jgi:non-specific serine/threonine protein kinase